MSIKILVYLTVLFLSANVFGQYVLETPDGKKVKLNTNGTWIFLKRDASQSTFSQIPKSSTSKYISRFKKYEFWYNPSEWLVDTTKKSVGYTWDAYFYSTDYAIQGYCLDSRLTMPTESIESWVKEQWQGVGEIKNFVSRKDSINNLPVTIYEMEYIQSGITYMYSGFVHSGIKGSFQMVLGTQKEIYNEDKNKIELLLKGFTKK
jgi:hypothetical protein